MTDTTQYKETLQEQLEQIIIDLQGLGIHNPDIAGDWIATPDEKIDAEPDKNVAADRSEDWQENRATLAALETRYNNINRALKKIENDTYGVCEICGDAIESDRLEANPSARTNKAHMNDEINLPR